MDKCIHDAEKFYYESKPFIFLYGGLRIASLIGLENSSTIGLMYLAAGLCLTTWSYMLFSRRWRYRGYFGMLER